MSQAQPESGMPQGIPINGAPSGATAPQPEGNTHSFVVTGTKFEVDRRYELIKLIGHGAYGVVVSALDRTTGEKVAIKKVPRAFDDLIDAKRILREIKLLRHFDHENIIAMRDILQPPSLDDFEDVYIISDLMETDLHRIIYSKQKLSDDHVQYFVYQMLRSLKYMHSAGVLHRDLKPSNLLLNSNCDLKVCDFGLARGVNDEKLDLTEYVVTRWYRAPEIMLSCKEYTFAIDVWSVGCILGELLGRKPMFPGEDYIHQLTLISDLLGKPSSDDLAFVTSEKARRFMEKQPEKPRVPFKNIYQRANPAAVDLLEKMLVFDPTKRITVKDALAHPYMASLANPSDEPDCPSVFEFEHESVEDFSKPMLQELIWKEMVHFHPSAQEALDLRKSQGILAIDALESKMQM
ncbi:Mitogen-activated protein kinase 6 [Hondaea fermentalgiana]|uniref:Mitogen-activated protein kinase n=1 Tax=Hondaea fermentalgiana TaxID=2315210 RepID=A0A2R5G4A2_9STRA|nr:Mitogen-activated protein kinase 6 [Hondaea fermentalgiana]|eukprot:GBG25385.1 Mitogen-activated protein kinase 6 [Hondaea fermentalgiana]